MMVVMAVMRMAMAARPTTVNMPATSPLFEKNLVSEVSTGFWEGRLGEG
jgi:hypothetical protein